MDVQVNGEKASIVGWFGFGAVRVQFPDGRTADIFEDEIAPVGA